MDRLNTSKKRSKPVPPGRLLFGAALLATLMISIGVSALLRVQGARDDDRPDAEGFNRSGPTTNQLVLLNPAH